MLAMAEGERSVLDLCAELVAALGMSFGELTVRVVGGEVTLLRQGLTLKPDALAQMPAAAGPARPAG